MLQLNFNQLYYFYVVATEGSIKAATEKLNITQPTISNQIKILEEYLGYRVFVREHRKLILNEKGKALLEKAEKIFVLAEEMVHDVHAGPEKERQKIKIGALPSLPNIFTHELCLKLWKDPNYAVSIVHGSTDLLIDKLDKGAVDFILMDNPYMKAKYRYRSFNLGSQRIVAVAAPKLIGLKKGFPKSLQGAPYLPFMRQGQIQDEVDYYLENNGVKPARIGEVDDVTLVRVVAEQGHCFSILPYSAAKESIKSGALVKIADIKEVKANFWLITTKLGARNVAIRKTVQAYQKKNN